MTNDELIEATARAIYGERDFGGLGRDVTERMFAVAQAAFARHRIAHQKPDKTPERRDCESSH